MVAPRFLFILVLAITAAGCAVPTAQVRREPPFVGAHPMEPPAQAHRELPRVDTRAINTSYGIAGWYGHEFHGQETASGERFDMHGYTAAHRELPFGTRVRVTNLRNGRHAIVRINDRGPFVRERVIDVSYIAARDLGMLETGLEEVRLEIMGE